MAFANGNQTEDTVNIDLLYWRFVPLSAQMPRSWSLGKTLLKPKQCMRGLYHPASRAEEHFGC